MINNLPPQNTVSDSNFVSGLKSPGLFRPVPEVNQTKPTDNDIRRPQSDFVLRGEFLQGLYRTDQLRSHFNQQIAPKNSTAINSYQTTVLSEFSLPERQGGLVNLFI